jgi:fatty acid desaturase
MLSMGGLVKLGATLTFNPMTMGQNALASVRRTAILIVYAVVAALIVLPAIGCLMAALWIFCAEPAWTILGCYHHRGGDASVRNHRLADRRVAV